MFLRPHITLNAATVGCSTVLASTKLVPAQKASVAEAPRSRLMMGRAVERMVASKDTASARIISADMAR